VGVSLLLRLYVRDDLNKGFDIISSSSSSTEDMPTDYKLTYFNGRGRAEIIRLVLTAAGVPFEDKRIEFSEMAALKPSLPFSQVPIFEFGDVKMCQSLAIARYLARKYNLAGDSELDQARADMIVDCIEDALKPVGVFARQEQDPTRKAQLKKTYIEEQLPVFLDKLEALLVANNGGKGYFVGDKLTWADLYLIRAYGNWQMMAGLESPFLKHQKLNELYKRATSQPKIADYMAKLPKTDF